MVRVFVGIILPKDIRVSIIKFQEKLKSLPFIAKFVEPENLHISLSFLGYVDQDELKKIELKIDKIVKSCEKFTVAIDGLMFIPSERSVRIIALDVVSERLEGLREEIVKAVGGRSYPAHLTLCRVKTIDDKGVSESKKMKFSGLGFGVNYVSLVESVLGRSGPTYKVIHESDLK